MNFIKRAIDKDVDESVHIQFQKFSKGEFRDRGVIEAKKQGGGKYTIKTSAEFANDLVRTMAEKLGENKTNITGAIVSTSDLTGEVKFKEKKQFQGVKRYLIDNEMSGKEIIDLMNKLPKTFFALSFSVEEDVIKIKPKAPKSGKPGKENEDGPKADFCSLKTSDSKIAKEFIFEKTEFIDAKINHTFFVENMVIPNELKTEKDFAKVREGARRAGRIVRKSNIDGIETTKEYPFEA